MTLNAEQLKTARKDIATVVEAIESKVIPNVSEDGSRLVAELVALDDADCDRLLANLEDTELRGQVELLRRLFKERSSAGVLSAIDQVGHSASINVSPRSLMIRLTFKAGHETLAASQDLEDTLWIGRAVVEVVHETMRGMHETLSLPAQLDCIGNNFEDNLKSVEAALGEIRQIYEVVRNADTLD